MHIRELSPTSRPRRYCGHRLRKEGSRDVQRRGGGRIEREHGIRAMNSPDPHAAGEPHVTGVKHLPVRGWRITVRGTRDAAFLSCLQARWTPGEANHRGAIPRPRPSTQGGQRIPGGSFRPERERLFEIMRPPYQRVILG